MTLTAGMFAHGTTFIVGSEKHAGKTTLLKHLVRMLRPVCAPAYLSIGVDGEGVDTLGGCAKPFVHAEAGDWIVTAESALDRSDLSVEIREVLPFAGVMGRPVLARVMRGGTVELIGPGENQQLSSVLARLREIQGVDCVLVDGAINRMTQVSAADSPACAFVLRVNRSNLPRALEFLRRLSVLRDVPTGAEGFAVDGALTTDVFAGLPECDRVVVEDFTRVFLSFAELTALQHRMTLTFRRRIYVRACVVNLYDVSRRELLDRLAGDRIVDRIAFNPYQEAA